MNSQAAGSKVAAIIFAIFALGYLIRLLNHVQVLVANHQIPMGLSYMGLIIGAPLGVWMWRLSLRRS